MMQHVLRVPRALALSLALAGSVTLLAGAAGAECGDPGCAEKKESCEQAKAAGGCGCADKAGAAAQAPAAPGLQAHIDPATGQLTAPPAGAAAGAAQAPSRAAGQAAAVANPTGGLEAELGPGYRAEVMATKDGSGEVKAKCNHGGAEH